MKTTFIKYKNENYNIPQLLGFNIEELKNPEEIDKKIEQLKEENYTTFIISNQLASFSENIINKYKYQPDIKIIITPSKNKI